ncbi:hypothetical protein M8C13_18105 [Crossiella sp. SN42]|uniref:helix-turn-helix domain-containing protein n=1 Tax=Crossiella sp. SN42 TaxID=2944808 RepID=UPI00207C630D|nr:hypothetical protein [Crossiella sp. SN42]MCO1577673.1 hypothetical protein [Crossiella sp. SN42]
MPAEFWNQPAIQDAAHARHIGQLIHAYRRAHQPVLTQAIVAGWLGLTQGHLSVIERSAQPETDLERLERWCDALHMPARLRWFRGPTSGDVAEDAVDDQQKTLAQLGLTYAASLPTTVDVVAELGRHDMERRRFLTSAAFAVAASVAPSRDWLLATLDEIDAARSRTGTGTISTEQVDAIRRTFGVFQELDVMRGGGHARAQLAAYLTEHVVPLLRSNDPDTEAGRALFEAAAEQLYLLGWMAFDNGEHAIAQRYLIQSLRLAQAAKNTELGAHVLAGLSDQATLTGHPDQGVQLARAGRAGLQNGYSPACLADLYALQARAEAAMGDGKSAALNVHLSEKAFESIDPENEPEWARFIDVAYLNGEYAHAFRDLKRPNEAAQFARLSVAEAERQNRARRGSLAQAALARAALDDHDLTAAASAGLAAAKLAATVKSSRSVEAVTDLRVRMRDHSGSPSVREFLDVSGALMPAMSSRA